MARKPRPTSPLNPFYGYPAELIAEWCGVSIPTAAHYKAGRRRPSRSVLRLFRLYRDKKVLGDEWDKYTVVHERLVGPDGRAITPSHIALWSIAWQLLAEKDPDNYHSLLQRAELETKTG